MATEPERLLDQQFSIHGALDGVLTFYIRFKNDLVTCMTLLEQGAGVLPRHVRRTRHEVAEKRIGPAQ
jgi:hypothetical protein